jgi:Tfp pilus assembly protein PilW
MAAPQRIADETGTTLIELMVALMTGLVIVSALIMLVLTTMHSTARVSARVEATQRARLTLGKLMDQLHSACVTPEIAPVKESSTGNLLRFVHQTGSAVAPTPVYSEISLNGSKLIQQDYGVTGSAPTWERGEAAGAPRTLLTGVAPVPPSSTIFSYYQYSGGTISETPQTTPLSETGALLTVEVRAALAVAPEHTPTPVADAGATANVQNSATLRLTPPSFNEGSPARPCQ